MIVAVAAVAGLVVGVLLGFALAPLGEEVDHDAEARRELVAGALDRARRAGAVADARDVVTGWRELS